MDEETKYCLCCGENVPCNKIVRDERKMVICAYCGFTLGVERLLKEKEVSVETYALIAEDSDFARKLLKGLVSKAKLASDVIAVTNGLELITEFTKLRNNKAKISFAIIDLSMPVMDGLTAASVIRSYEEKEEDAVKIPIVFFSAVKADEELRKQMELLAPAHYLNKGSDPDPRGLVDRIHMLLNLVSRYQQKA
jgi:CheY-like chemotaxis protein